MVDNITESNMVAELGLTEKRADELVNIVQSIVGREIDNEYGRTSSVLLEISGRKDLSDTEKVICSFIFSCGNSDMFVENPASMSTCGKREEPVTTRFDMGSGMSMDCMVIAPDGMPEHDIQAITISLVISLMRKMPKDVAIDFCKNARDMFARIAETGDVRS